MFPIQTTIPIAPPLCKTCCQTPWGWPLPLPVYGKSEPSSCGLCSDSCELPAFHHRFLTTNGQDT
eukprot:scaffold39557_cov59-Attheya_sp.AAC.4